MHSIKKATALSEESVALNFIRNYLIKESKHTFPCALSPYGKKRNTCLSGRHARDMF